MATMPENVLAALPGMPPATSGDAPTEIRLGWIVIGLFFGLFLGVAAFVRLDAAAYADGMVSVAGRRQAVQHRDGGLVSALYVREGQHVAAGDVLIDLAAGEVAANERALAAQAIGLQAERARLIAEQAGLTTVAPPPAFAALTGEDRALARTAMRLQIATLAARRAALAAQGRVLAQQTAQLRERIDGLREQMAQSERQRVLFRDQLAGMQAMATKGFVSLNRVREVERALSSVSSDKADFASSSAAAREQIGERRMQALTLVSQNLRDVATDMGKADEAFAEVWPKWQAARRIVEQTRIRAPSTGQVVGLTVFTVGGVVQAGQKLMEIVPDAARLVIEARISPDDADDVRVGQTAEIRFPTLHERDVPTFEGKVSRLSADSFTDDRTGARYYTGDVTVAPAILAQIGRLKGAGESIRAGMPVQVLIPLRKRTLLRYLAEPLDQALWRSGREH